MIIKNDLIRYGISYNPITGDLTGRSIYYSKGYLAFKFLHKKYKVHRIAFLWMTGKFSNKSIDHINRNKIDNRWENLREVTDKQNADNRYYGAKYGRGVYWSYRKYQAQINVNGKKCVVGRFSNVSDAVRAFVIADINAHDNYEEAWV
mgnify:CR=1 FL=1